MHKLQYIQVDPTRAFAESSRNGKCAAEVVVACIRRGRHQDRNSGSARRLQAVLRILDGNTCGSRQSETRKHPSVDIRGRLLQYDRFAIAADMELVSPARQVPVEQCLDVAGSGGGRQSEVQSGGFGGVDQRGDAGAERNPSFGQQFPVPGALALVQQPCEGREIRSRSKVRRAARGVMDDAFPASSDVKQPAVKVDVPIPVESGLGERKIEGDPMPVRLGVGDRAINVENDCLQFHGCTLACVLDNFHSDIFVGSITNIDVKGREMKNVTLRQLRIFESAARHLSFSRAAEELFLTQPAVSMQIKQLEESAGIRLFEHIGKRVFLTQAGKELLLHARAIAHQIREAEAAMAALSGSFAGLLDIALISTAKYFVPGLLAQFRKRFPQCEIKLSVHNREQLLAKLHANECDLAVMGQPPEGLDCVAEVFASNPLAFVSAPSHPMSRRHRLALADLENEIFLIRESGSGTRGAMERLLAERKVAPQRYLEMGSNETVKQAVMADLGIALISLQTARHEIAGGRVTILQVEGLPLLRHWHVVHLRQKNLSPLTDEFRRFLIVEGAALIETI